MRPNLEESQSLPSAIGNFGHSASTATKTAARTSAFWVVRIGVLGSKAAFFTATKKVVRLLSGIWFAIN